jgi:autotransporter-associated beta strand protein
LVPPVYGDDGIPEWNPEADLSAPQAQIPPSVRQMFFRVKPGRTKSIDEIIADQSALGTSIVKLGRGTLVLNGLNTYSGGTMLYRGSLIANGDGTLGLGNVNLNATRVALTLQNGATNNYISDNARLTIGNGSKLNLNFNGTDFIRALVINGVAQTIPGTYGSSASDAQFKLDNIFLGPGTLTLVPEPSTWIMTIVGASLLLSVQRFRRRKKVVPVSRKSGGHCSRPRSRLRVVRAFQVNRSRARVEGTEAFLPVRPLDIPVRCFEPPD